MKCHKFAQKCHKFAQNCHIFGSIPRGKCNYLRYLIYLEECFHSLCSFKYSKTGVRSVLENLTHSLAEKKKLLKPLVLWRIISPDGCRLPLGLSEELSTRVERVSLLREKTKTTMDIASAVLPVAIDAARFWPERVLVVFNG